MSPQREVFEKSKETLIIFLNQMKVNGLKLIQRTRAIIFSNTAGKKILKSSFFRNKKNRLIYKIFNTNLLTRQIYQTREPKVMARVSIVVQNIMLLSCTVLCIFLITKCWKKFTAYFEWKNRSASNSSRGNAAFRQFDTVIKQIKRFIYIHLYDIRIFILCRLFCYVLLNVLCFQIL